MILPPFPAQVEKHDDIDLDEWLAGLYIMLKGSRFVPLRSFALFLFCHQHLHHVEHPPEQKNPQVICQ